MLPSKFPVLQPRSKIYAAFYSAFVRHPKVEDPTRSNRWIEPAQSAHLTRVVMLELEANGFQIVRKL
jgi:hypothetical protein